ncbi:predicted protein [Sparassis crispa]|uniref:Rap-GAP domain-containing protein n=1 Tax=Sparassis crispa TaxID=139825 RepID=A0A401GYI8_9APHY|nr:predicted protein [Sparassis crispa]GBE87114.1 predicted protein [Sparassis crispa]
MEGSILRVLEVWIEGAFEGLTIRGTISQDERAERQRSVEKLTALLTALVGNPEFVSRLSAGDTSGVLQLWGRLIDKALFVPTDHRSPPMSPVADLKITPQRVPSLHRRHHSSTSIPQLLLLKHPADLAVDAYLTYLSTRLRALAPSHLQMILPLLFRALAFYATPLPRISLTPLPRSSSPHDRTLEERVVSMLEELISGPFSSSCMLLVKHFLIPSHPDLRTSIQISVGALKTLRSSIRRVFMSRLARAYIARTSSMQYTPAGVPSQVDLERGLMELAWAKDEAVSWDLIRVRSVLCRATRAWIEKDHEADIVGAPKEMVLYEIASILKDTVQALDERGEGEEVDDEEVSAVGDILQELVGYVRSLKTREGGIIPISLSQTDESSPFLNALSTLLAQDLMTTPLYPVLPSIILSVSGHLPDAETSQLLVVMSERQCLSPTSPSWLDYWGSVLAIPDLYSPSRPTTRQMAMDVLQSVWEFVKDIPVYRRPLASLVFNFWRQQMSDEMDDVTVSIMWRILGDEVVLRNAEYYGQDATASSDSDLQLAEEILTFLTDVASEKHEDDEDATSIRTTETQSPSPHGQAQFSPGASAVTSPTVSRMQSDVQAPARDKEASMPSVMSLFTSLTSGHSSRSQSRPRPSQDRTPMMESPSPVSEVQPMPKAVGAVAALVSVFSQLAFTPLVLVEGNAELGVRVFRTLVDLISTANCVRARLAVLQFLVRLRVDRDHRLYFTSADYDKHGHVSHLASLINRTPNAAGSADEVSPDQDFRRARPRVPQERDGRRVSRGRGGPPSKIEPSRSRSRVATRLLSTPLPVQQPKARAPMWSIPETLMISVTDVDTPSEGLISYDPAGPGNRKVLPLSSYLLKIIEIIKTEKEWEILSYILCHLSAQLANKHLVCGPKSRAVIAQLLSVLCTAISEGKLAATIERWPEGIIPRDAHGLAYHTLTVLISYKRCFMDVQLQHHLVEVFLLGLSGQPSTIKCCLHALSLSAFELQPSMTKYLSRILEKLSQIMSNPAMAVHIIDFLSIVGSLHSLHANFTDGDYKMVFGVALQYLQHHNRPDETLSISWALSQHVRIMSYYIVYLWFLAVKLPDRPRHIKFITRQLLLANEGKNEVDEPAEVCFDWLARYAYASADPRPAHSMLDEVVMNPIVPKGSPEPALCEKTWILGNSVVTIRALARRGWMEVLSRRASGLTKFLCRAENVPMILPGDVDPDFVSISASLSMERGLGEQGPEGTNPQTVCSDAITDTDRTVRRPDPITGYVWSGSAPSQRRKEVSIDPAYVALQISSYPDNGPTTRGRLVTDTSRMAAFFRTLDRMPVIDTHKVGIMYVAPGQTKEGEILRNTHGSPAYGRFLEGLARLIDLRGQVDVYAGGLDPAEDGEYAYAWWDDIGQILYHTATLMPSSVDESCTNKKRHIGNDYVRIVWNDSGMPYRFDTLSTQFQFVNIVIEPHSRGAIAAFSNNFHENEYFQVVVQRAPGMTEFTPIGDFKLISAENLPLLVRQLSLLADWFVSVFQHTKNDTVREEMTTNWRSRLQAIKRFRAQMSASDKPEPAAAGDGVMGQEIYRDFTTAY